VVLAPVTVAPTEYFANVEDVVGRTPLVDLDAGQPITPRFFKDTNQIARRVPPGQRALSLKVDDVVGVGGFVRPGDTVDVLVFIKSTTDTPTGAAKGKSDDVATQARMLLKDVLVISYEEHLVEPPKGIEKQDPNKQAQQQRRERTAVVAVPEEQVQRVLLGASIGDLRLSLHGTQTADAGPAAPPADGAAAAPAGAPISAVSAATPADAKGKVNEPPPPDGVITMLELTRLRNAKNGIAPIAPPKPTVQIIRGTESKHESVYP
jgi:pilus assembly protein CpaB